MPGSIETKLDAIIKNQQTLADEVHGVVQRIGDLERWKADQDGERRFVTRSISDNDARDEVRTQMITNMVAALAERMDPLQKSVDALTSAQAEVVETNRHQTEAVQSLKISASMQPVVSKLKRRMPAYLAIAAMVGAVFAAFVQAYLHAKGVAP